MLLALGTTTPLLLVWWAMEAASWRPVKVAEISMQKQDGLIISSPSNHSVLRTIYTHTASLKTLCTLFDTQSGKEKEWNFSGKQRVGMQDGFFWHLQQSSRKPYPFILEVESSDGQKRKFEGQHHFGSAWSPAVHLHLYPSQKRAILNELTHVYVWDFQTGHPINEFEDSKNRPSYFSVDGSTFIVVGPTQLLMRDISTGRVVKTVPIHQKSDFVWLSPHGRYAELINLGPAGGLTQLEVATGKPLWHVPTPQSRIVSVDTSADEKTLLLQNTQAYDVLDAKTGKLLHRLSIIKGRGYSPAALSPDGSVLYYVADGVLYKQRVR